jgi:hypothetical protein
MFISILLAILAVSAVLLVIISCFKEISSNTNTVPFTTILLGVLRLCLVATSASTVLLVILGCLPDSLKEVCYGLIPVGFGAEIIVPFVKNRPGRSFVLRDKIPFELSNGNLKINPFLRGDGVNLIPDVFCRKGEKIDDKFPLVGTWFNINDKDETIKFTKERLTVQSPYFNTTKARYRITENKESPEQSDVLEISC